MDQLTSTFHSLDSVLKNFNSILDPRVKGNLQSTIANITMQLLQWLLLRHR